jgi:acetyltransferase-like isoleucine patch superfamily enzyme
MGIIKKTIIKMGIPEKVLDTFYPINKKKLRLFFKRHKLRKCGWAGFIGHLTVIEGLHGLEMGDYAGIGSCVHIWAHGGVIIGESALIASHVSITSLTHDYEDSDSRYGDIISKPVIIGKSAWIGTHAVILPGITIGEGAFVGAGAVVTKDVPDYAIVTGSPAKILKYRYDDTGKPDKK